uniref:Plasmid replication initiation factor n=1 Tax=Schlesneria paludicola TaxID=360056 RepID=A0A7C2PI70_9PLAN
MDDLSAPQGPSRPDGALSPSVDTSSGDTPPPASDATPGMALSVTRHAHFTEVSGWEFLAAGIDSLDLGVFVEWGPLWSKTSEALQDGKERAAGTKGLLSSDGRYLIHPSGKPPNYRWHLEWPEFHVFLGISQQPQGKTPNVYVSVNSRALWELSVNGVVDRLRVEIARMGGRIVAIKPSRCDLAADYRIPSELSLEFLRAHRVPAHVQHWHIMSGDDLETFYQGAKRSPIQLRLYGKGREVEAHGTKLWLLDVWKLTSLEHVWRVEFQIRRPVLKQFGINTLEDLAANLGGLWQYLTGDWFSLRRPDDSNTTRRTVHPFWVAVQECAEKLGPALTLRREFTGESADAEWFVNHCAGCLASFAAREGMTELEEAATLMFQRIINYWRKRCFAEAVAAKGIPLGDPRVIRPDPSDLKDAA